MNHIKRITIEGFKKFRFIQIDFNEHMNILVGENEAGKSTILDSTKMGALHAAAARDSELMSKGSAPPQKHHFCPTQRPRGAWS